VRYLYENKTWIKWIPIVNVVRRKIMKKMHKQIARLFLIGVGMFCFGISFAHAERQCSRNFVMEQDRFGARTYKTWAVLQGASHDRYFDALYRYAVKEGLRIDAKDREMGTITGSSEVSFSNGKRVSYNFMVEDLSDGSTQITLVCQTPGGTFSKAVDAEKYFCEVIASIG
jgi:hypothetical protein